MARERSELFIVPRAAEDLPFTGERFTFAAGGVIEQEHTHRYFFALDLCRGRDVLDVASGEGYGSALLGLVARSVIGVDLDAASVEHATRNYGDPHVAFRVGDTSALPLEEASVDVVVSFETLEHTEGHDQFLAEIRRVLRPGGLLVMSSPDRDVYSPVGPHNPYHQKELDRAEFTYLVRRTFPHVTLLGQRSMSGSCLAADDEPLSARTLFFERLGVNQLKLSVQLPKPMYLVAVASDRELPRLPSSLLLDGRYANWLEMERQRLSAALESSEGSVAELGGLLDAARSDQARLASERAELVAALERARDDLRQLAATHKTATATRDSRIREMEESLERSGVEIASLLRRLSEKEARVDALEVSVRQDAQRLSQLEGERDRLEAIASAVPALEESLHQELRARSQLEAERDRLEAIASGVPSLEEALRQEARARSLLEAERERLAASAGRVPALEESLREHARQLSALVAQRDSLLSSTFWRLTFPLRWLVIRVRAARASARGKAMEVRQRFVRLGLGRWRRDARTVAGSGLFDAAWYLEQNPDVAASGLAPLEHFAKYGAAEGRDPHPLFSTRRYLDDNPDVARSGWNALAHFVLRGRAEGRRPQPSRSPRPAGAVAPVAHRYSVNERRLARAPELTRPGRLPVLCVTHVPPWPRRAGNEYRIGRLLDWLASRGHPLLVVMAPLDGRMPAEEDLQELASRYGSIVVTLPDGRVEACLDGPELSLSELDGREIVASGGGGSALETLERAFCHDALVGLVLELERRAAPCLLYVNYIFMTRFLPLTSGRSASFVDTHDVFSTKGEKIGRFGIADPLDLSPAEEARCLRRADAVLAIQVEEARVLAGLTLDRPVLTVGVDFETDDATADLPTTPTVVCIASDNALNLKGLRDFLRFAWPSIRREVPGAKLLLAGKAAAAVEAGDTDNGIEVRGDVEDVAPLYREARVAINPVVGGTGLKIKSLEALRHFRPIVTFPHGVDGVTDADLLRLCHVVRDWYEFAECTEDLLRNDVAPPDAEVCARIRRALSPDVVYRELERWLDEAARAARGERPRP